MTINLIGGFYIYTPFELITSDFGPQINSLNDSNEHAFCNPINYFRDLTLKLQCNVKNTKGVKNNKHTLFQTLIDFPFHTSNLYGLFS